MAALRRRELSNLETRARRNSELRKRNSQLSQRGNSAINGDAAASATPSKSVSAAAAADEPEVLLSVTDVNPEIREGDAPQQQQQQEMTVIPAEATTTA